MRRLGRFGAVLVMVVAMLALSVATAFADSPHFISEGTASILNSGAYQVANFKEAGLGNTTTEEEITLFVTKATATYACINGGGNHPKASNKETVEEQLQATETFPVRNGQTTGTIEVGPPGPGSFSCPSGQKLELAFVTYTGVELRGLAGDTSPEPNLSRCFIPGVGIC